jgi:stress response protein SCP2
VYRAHVPIIGDIPAENPRLGFQEFADAIVHAICDGEPAQFTLAVYGQWGTGKSTLLKEIRRRLAEREGQVIPVFFDAWRYEGVENIVVPLVDHIAGAVGRISDTGLGARLGRMVRGILENLEAEFFWGAVRLRGGGGERNDGNEAGGKGHTDAFVAAARQLDELSEVLAASHTRIVLLIDDLDRCQPARVVDVIEAIKVVLNAAGIVSVIAMDYHRLISALDTRYGPLGMNAYSFMEKIVQAEFHLPPFVLDRATYWADLNLDRVDDPELTDDFRSLLHGIASDALDSNPRQIKRYLNTFLLNRRILQRRAGESDTTEVQVRDEVKQLAVVIGFQLGYPASFQAWQRSGLTTETGKIAALIAEPDGGPDGRTVPDPRRAISAKDYVTKYFTVLHPADLETAQALTDRLKKQKETVTLTTDLPDRIRVRVAWSVRGPDVDLTALMVAKDGRVPHYDYFVYYRNRRSLDRAVSHRGDVDERGTTEEIDVDLSAVDPDIDQIVFALSLYEPTTGGLAAIGPVVITLISDATVHALVTETLKDAFQPSHTGATLGRLERVGAEWNFSQTTKPYDTGLAGIGHDYGVDLA